MSCVLGCYVSSGWQKRWLHADANLDVWTGLALLHHNLRLNDGDIFPLGYN